jgi:hypothetical protein
MRKQNKIAIDHGAANEPMNKQISRKNRAFVSYILPQSLRRDL